jgi:hypothetical protein
MSAILLFRLILGAFRRCFRQGRTARDTHVYARHLRRYTT